MKHRGQKREAIGFIFERGWDTVVEDWLKESGINVTRSENNRMVLLDTPTRRIVVGTRSNCPGIAVDLELMRKEYGVVNVFRLGTCGGYERTLRVGSLVLVTDAIRGEGTSRCYIDQETFPAACDFMLSRRVSETLDAVGLRYLAGTFWTSDGRIVQQYERKVIMRMIKNHVLGVDMDSSGFFVVSKLLGMRSANLSVVTDIPLRTLKYTTYSYTDPKIEGGLRACIHAYMKCLFGLVRNAP